MAIKPTRTPRDRKPREVQKNVQVGVKPVPSYVGGSKVGERTGRDRHGKVDRSK